MKARAFILAAVAAASAYIGPAAASTPPLPAEGAPYLLDAIVSIPRHGAPGYLNLFLYVTRALPGTNARTELSVDVQECYTSCVDQGWSTTELPETSLRISADMTSARLAATWLGRPLHIEWSQNRRPPPLADGNVAILAGYYKAVFEKFHRVNATSQVTLLGRSEPCPGYELSTVISGMTAQASRVRPLETQLSPLPELRERKVGCV